MTQEGALPERKSEISWKWPAGTFPADHMMAWFEQNAISGTVTDYYRHPDPPVTMLRVWFTLEFEDGSQQAYTAKIHPSWVC